MPAKYLWKPSSWRKYLANQQPVYHDNIIADLITHKISDYKELVSLPSILQLNNLLYKAADRQAIILQAGDCAESFTDCSKNKVRAFIELLTQAQQIITASSNKNVIKIGRIAGQFSKPRTSSNEMINNRVLPVYRGDMINDSKAEYDARMPDPRRMFQAYNQAYNTLKQIDYFTNKHNVIENKSYFQSIYTSHEALLLPYEQALSRQDKSSNNWYSGSAHSLWVGKRTINYNHAHIEFIRGIINPIGVKICHDISADELITLLNIINPNNLQGKVMLIIRMGKHINDQLPKLVSKIKTEKKSVLWLSDPMHGNTYCSSTGYKTRNLADIYQEIESFVTIINKYDEYSAGLHLEVSPFFVTECIDNKDIKEKDLAINYQSLCDPRLNPQQVLSVANFFANCLLK